MNAEPYFDERKEALALSNRIMDKPAIDPDGDICMLARQLLLMTADLSVSKRAYDDLLSTWAECRDLLTKERQRTASAERRLEALRELFTRETDEGPVYDFSALDDMNKCRRLTDILG